VEKLAEAAHLSPRQFRRAFAAETGELPAKAVENLRVEAARLMLEDSRHPLETIARQTGFADRERIAAGIRARIRPATPSDAATGSKGRPTWPRRPAGSLRALGDADQMVSPAAATLRSNAPSGNSR